VFWDEGHRIILDAFSSHDDYLLVHLENLGSDEGATAKRIFEFFELPAPAQDRLIRALNTRVNSKSDSMWSEIHRIKTEANAPLLPDNHAEWTNEFRHKLISLCGETAVRLGYSLE
jgi:hypothetical protein